MKAPTGHVATLEARIIDEVLGDANRDLLASHAEGTRRALRLRVKDVSFSTVYDEANGSVGARVQSVDVRFELEPGAYATTVLGEVFALRDTSPPHDND
jgi:tRNA(Glu) U13 pseudouridine synthase TruD